MVTASPPSELEPAIPGPEQRSAAGTPGDVPGLPPIICPFLAARDGSWRSVEPSRSHVCAAVQPPAVLAITKQRQLCLAAAHADCATFMAARVLLGESAADPGEADLWPRSSSRVTTLEPVRTGITGGITTPQARAGGQALLVGLIVIAFAVLVVTRSTPAGSSGPVGGTPAPTAAGLAGASAGPATSARPAPTPSTAAPPASPSITGSPAASPSTSKTYKVKRGDTLSSIAVQFGVTVKALRTANALAKNDVIRRGQVLVIPVPQATPAP